MDKKIICFAILIIFMISIISAFEFDNTKIYDAQQKEVTIKNSFDLPLLSEDVAKLKLTSDYNHDFIIDLDMHVGLGYKQIGEFQATPYLDNNGGLDIIETYDLNNKMEKIDRHIDLKVKSIKKIEVPDYQTICIKNLDINKTENATQECSEEQIGSHLENQTYWKDLDYSQLQKNKTYTIGLFTDVKEGDHVEWIPTFYGVKINEWASWTADLNTDLIGYWKLDETTGTNVQNQIAGNNGTASADASTLTTTGIINGGFDFSGTNYVATADDGTFDLTADFTINAWLKWDGQTTNYPDIIEKGDHSGAGHTNWDFGLGATDGVIRFSSLDSTWRTYEDSSATVLPNGDWAMATIVVDTTANFLRFYVNGVSVSNVSYTYTPVANNDALHFGKPDGHGVGYTGGLDEVGIWDRILNSSEISLIYNNGNGLGYNSSDDVNPIVILNSPENYYNSTSSTVVLNCTAYDDIQLDNVSLYLNGILNETNSSGLNNTAYIFSRTIGDGDYNWTCVATDNISQSNTASWRYFSIDITSPVLSIANNLTDLVTTSLPVSSVWNYTVTDANPDKCYYNTSDNATYTIETCNSSITTNWATEGSKTIQYCANDTFGHETCNTTSINVYSIQEAQADNPDPIAEGYDATFNLTLNMTSIPTTTATLILNNTVYAPTTTQSSTNGYYFEVDVNIPDGWGNTTGNIIDWFWNYTIDGIVTNQSTSTTNITVYELAVDNCSIYGEVILNLSLNDEETNAFVNESAGADVEIDMTLTSKENSSVYVQYHNTWTNENNPTVCIPLNILNNTDYWIDFTIGFDSTDHVWEFYYLDDGTLNSSKEFNSMTNYTIDLMDLLTADSTSFLFNYFDQDGLPVDDAIVHVFRKYIGDGQFLEIERSKADQNGDTIVHLVEEDVIYYFVISQYGVPLYTSSTYTALCQTTPCEIQIEASGGFAEFPTDYDLIDGGAISISSNSSTREVTLDYALNSSATMNFTVYKYNSDGSYSSVQTGSDTGTSGSITLTVPLSAGNVSFFTSVSKDNQFVKSEWVDFEAKATDIFGRTLSLFIAGLIILTLGLIAVTEGAGTIVMVILGIFLSGALGLMTTKLSTGVNIVVYLILAGGLILWKITKGRRG